MQLYVSVVSDEDLLAWVYGCCCLDKHFVFSSIFHYESRIVSLVGDQSKWLRGFHVQLAVLLFCFWTHYDVIGMSAYALTVNEEITVGAYQHISLLQQYF